MGVVGFARFGVLCAFVEEVFVLFEPCFQAAFKVGSAAVFQRPCQVLQLFACCRLRVARQVAADGFDLVEMAKLYGDIGEQLQQTLTAVADDALYFNAFGFQAADGFSVKGVGFVFDFGNRKRFAADAVEQNHDAETASEVGGVHHDVGALGRGKLRFGRGFFEMAQDGLAAASVGGGKLCSGLFACSVGLP